MAIIFPGKSQCPICGLTINQDDRFVATSHFIADRDDPLWPFSDAAMHFDCFQTWPHRPRFVELYNKLRGPHTAGNGTYHDMQPEGTILIRNRTTRDIADSES